MTEPRALRIATFNANSIRMRLGIVLDWLGKEKPDVLAVQETKVVDELFPREAFESAGWHVAFRGQKGYNGVALVSRRPLEDVCTELDPKNPKAQQLVFFEDWERPVERMKGTAAILRKLVSIAEPAKAA